MAEVEANKFKRESESLPELKPTTKPKTKSESRSVPEPAGAPVPDPVFVTDTGGSLVPDNVSVLVPFTDPGGSPVPDLVPVTDPGVGLLFQFSSQTQRGLLSLIQFQLLALWPILRIMVAASGVTPCQGLSRICFACQDVWCLLNVYLLTMAHASAQTHPTHDNNIIFLWA